jgi:hypothetical protein
MSSSFADQSSVGQVGPAARPTDAERALLLAVAAWGTGRRRHDEVCPPATRAVEFLASATARLAPAASESLRDALVHGASLAGSTDPRQALDELSKLHRSTARVDLSRVHPSWWVRAVREESPTVMRVVAASLPRSLRFVLQAGLLLDSQDLKSERPAAAEVTSWVMSLWTERLVGGEAERTDDPPAIIVLSRLSPRAGYRLCRLAGFCKLILADHDQAGLARATARPRRKWLEDRLATADLDLRSGVQTDVQGSQISRLPPRHRPARIGLTTIARLLANAEPFRLRWALQHWPYPIAKLIRSLMPTGTSRTIEVFDGETLILKTAWDCLASEGKVALPWPESSDAKPRSQPT